MDEEDDSAAKIAEAFPVLKVRVAFAPGIFIGPGKAALLAAIDETGSIRAAGARFAMSYRRAWTLVSELNAMFDEPLVSAGAGGRGGGGAKLTETGRFVMERFRSIEAAARAAAADDVERLTGRLKRESPP
ncbi:molybdate transport system regulatory protein [Faunimonas pinastri]|uniref:Molybdate transport system regulatory protein n=1 Tax=Faunimonas pinastri TaxID=1855383 RepID=A0A1H9NS30_9HYPH|nr:LysR family transcriptional regulator [Faunimonas pinastri]SER38780.1 molybdate transport system regulatory protein [Faunimonas pinastri]